MINTKKLKHSLMAVRFALWELQLYLDTHPGDSEAMCLMRGYRESYSQLLKEYECKYGAITSEADESCSWTSTPFPWVNNGSDC